MRRPLIVATMVAAALACVALPRTASAQLQARLRLAGGYSAGTPLAGQGPNDVYGEARPELILLLGRPTASLTANYALTAALHTQSVAGNQLSNRFGLVGRLEAGPRAVLQLGIDVTQATVANLLLSGAASETPLTLLPALDTQTLTMGGRQLANIDLARHWTLNEQLTGTLTRFTTYPPDTSNSTLDLTLGVDRTWPTSSLGLEARAGYYHYGVALGLPDLSRQLPVQTDQGQAQANVRARLDLTRSFSASGALGGAGVLGLGETRGLALALTGRAGLNFNRDGYSLDLSFNRSPTPSIFAGQTSLTNSLALRGAFPLSLAYRVVANGSVGWNNQTVGLATALNPPTVNSVLADVGLGWQPIEGMEVFARYQMVMQRPDAAALVAGNPESIRHTATAGLVFSYPPTAPTPLSLRAPQRVDGTDGVKSR